MDDGRPPPFQFNLRTLFLVTASFAVSLAAATQSPTPHIISAAVCVPVFWAGLAAMLAADSIGRPWIAAGGALVATLSVTALIVNLAFWVAR
jgi:hypothetical protein